MKKNKKYTYLILVIIIILAIVFLPRITYTIDSSLVEQDKRPIFVIKRVMVKDGGTIVYMGFGYQVIKWNRLTDKGAEIGYEIYKAPNYRDVNDGPTKKLKIVQKK